MKKNKPIQNHPNQTNFIVFYCETYDDEARRGLAHKKQKKNKENFQKTMNSGALILHNDDIQLQISINQYFRKHINAFEIFCQISEKSSKQSDRAILA